MWIPGFGGWAGQMTDSRTALSKDTEELDPLDGTWTKLESCVCGELGKILGKHRSGIK